MDDNRSKIGQNWMKQKPVLDETQMQTLFFYYLIRLDQPQALGCAKCVKILKLQDTQ